ncbi:inverse autotransporter beta domain-containing protein [Enterobacteriaceae endosymbiont of Donacia dentata]|uniref:inverse autotransporter beta domain-containing protein n=1 Tax=Enterobacteriaceae endosymbiont of Donacia dentata TaxID=2675777 RepID=UPI001B3AB0F7|nr:inverse autotransporter beta domain-containing protein [Enterobacteriaceae endosymbiont of Donacia dentata]
MNKINKQKIMSFRMTQKVLKFFILTLIFLTNINYTNAFNNNKKSTYIKYSNNKKEEFCISNICYLNKINKILIKFINEKIIFYIKLKIYSPFIINKKFKKLNFQIKLQENTKNKNTIFNKFLSKKEIIWYNLKKNYNRNSYSPKYLSDLYSYTKKNENNTKSNDFQKNLFNFLLLAKNLFLNKHPNSNQNFIEGIKLIFIDKINTELNQKIQSNISKMFDLLQINGKSSIILNLDENLNLNNSEMDILIPIIENEDLTFFVQNNIHKTDNRIQNNLGFGIRKLSFDNEHMLGLNTFFDYDFTLENSRLGLGAEYWKEFIKLSVNSYYGLSKWWHLDCLKKKKNLNDINDNEFYERPATGWNIEAEGYFPRIPEIKFKFSYEKYYGNIGFKKNDNGFENEKLYSPSLFLFDINYHPIPLLTFYLQKTKSFSGKSNTMFGMQLNFKFNCSLHDQINTEFPNIFSSADDHRYDFVNRNNNILLEYRNKFLIKLFAKKEITGYPGSKIFLDVEVNAVNKVKNLHFNINNNFLQNGGFIESITKNKYIINLPNYDFKNNNKNFYKLRIIASDIEGNKDVIYSRIHVFAPFINKNFSTLTAFPEKVLVKSEKSRIILEARDINNKVLSNINDISFFVEKSSFADKHNVHISKVIENPKGTYYADVMSFSPGKVFLKVKIGDMINQELSKKINFVLPSVDNMVISVTNYKNKILESNVIVSKTDVPLNFLITVYDKHGKRFKFSKIEIHNIMAKDRQGNIRRDSGKLKIEDVTNKKSFSGNNFSSLTDKNGNLNLRISDPFGIGVCTTINIVANKYVTKKMNLIFTVETSPNTIHAQMYGHMVDYIWLHGIKYERPTLMSERTGDQVYHYLNEDWAKFTWDNANEYCKSINHFLPSREELASFNSLHSGEDLLSNYGWPIIQRYSRVWTKTSIVDRYFPELLRFYIDFKNGNIEKAIPSNIFTVFCIIKRKDFYIN